MSTGYNFYFDETYHDKSITLSNNQLNILADNLLDDYIGFFWGTRETNVDNISGKLSAFESKYLKLFDLSDVDELKSRRFKNKQFLAGIHSFSKVMLGFYTDLFNLCNSEKMIFQLNVVSKMEILVRRLFPDRNWFVRNGFVYDSFVYSFSKFLVFYNHTDLITELSNLHLASEEDRINIIKQTISKVVDAGENVARKEREVLIFKQLLVVLNRPGITVAPVDSQDWVYFVNYDGLCNLLKEISINPRRVSVYIDEEDHTVAAADGYTFKHVEGLSSTENICIRLADWLAGFVGKMVWSIVHDPQITEEKVTDINGIKTAEFSRKRMLSPSWFILNEAKFTCYKAAATCYVRRQPHRWTLLHCAYADHIIEFFTLLRYIDQYDYNSYSSISPEEHRDKYTVMCLRELEAYYQKHLSS